MSEGMISAISHLAKAMHMSDCCSGANMTQVLAQDLAQVCPNILRQLTDFVVYGPVGLQEAC